MDESLIQQLSLAIGNAVGDSIKSSNEDIIKKLDALQKTVVKVGTTAAASTYFAKKRSSQTNQQNNKSNKQNVQQNKLLQNILNQLSIALPGGARAFGIGRLYKTFQRGTNVMTKFVLGLVTVVGFLGAITDVLYQLSQQLGGVSLARAAFEGFKSGITSLKYLFFGEIINPLRTLQLQGTFAKEFGGLIGTRDAAEMQLINQRIGISVGEIVELYRVFQSTGMNVESAVEEFLRIGVVGRVAAVELSKSADFIARAGGEFNRFIRDGIVEAKKLGLEFSDIEKTLSGFSSDFEGTITQFSQLRAVIPGFGINFGELLGTALFGTTTEYTELIRQGLLSAGITTTAGLSRVVTSQLEAATGFGVAELDRILKDQAIGFDQTLELDKERNYLLKLINGTLVTGLSYIALKSLNRVGVLFGGSKLGRATGAIGATGMGAFGILGSNTLGTAFSEMGHPNIGAAIGMGGSALFGGMAGFGFGGIPGAVLGTLLGALTGFGIQSGFNDFIFRPGQPAIAFNPNDTVVGVKNTSDLSNRNLENKVDRLIMTMDEQLRLFKNGLFVEMRDLDKAIIRQREASIRNY